VHAGHGHGPRDGWVVHARLPGLLCPLPARRRARGMGVGVASRGSTLQHHMSPNMELLPGGACPARAGAAATESAALLVPPPTLCRRPRPPTWRARPQRRYGGSLPQRHRFGPMCWCWRAVAVCRWRRTAHAREPQDVGWAPRAHRIPWTSVWNAAPVGRQVSGVEGFSESRSMACRLGARAWSPHGTW
jgi:hypothetical protein